MRLRRSHRCIALHAVANQSTVVADHIACGGLVGIVLQASRDTLDVMPILITKPATGSSRPASARACAGAGNS